MNPKTIFLLFSTDPLTMKIFIITLFLFLTFHANAGFESYCDYLEYNRLEDLAMQVGQEDHTMVVMKNVSDKIAALSKAQCNSNLYPAASTNQGLCFDLCKKTEVPLPQAGTAPETFKKVRSDCQNLCTYYHASLVAYRKGSEDTKNSTPDCGGAVVSDGRDNGGKQDFSERLDQYQNRGNTKSKAE